MTKNFCTVLHFLKVIRPFEISFLNAFNVKWLNVYALHFWITGNLPFLVKLWAMVQNKIAFMGEKLIESFTVPRLLPGQYYKKENHVHGG